MNVKKIIFIFLIIFALFLFLVEFELLKNLQKNNQSIKQKIFLNNLKQREIKTEEKKEEQKIQNTIINTDDNLNNISDNKKRKEAEEKKYYKVVRVIDGDTIVINIEDINEVIRLIGINTPEVVDPRKPVECFGKEASKKAHELLDNKSVFLEKDTTQAERDKYGRLLRYVKIKDGLFYNLEIIKQGYAHEYTYIVPYKYQNEFKEAEDYARVNKLGLWADGVCDIKNN